MECDGAVDREPQRRPLCRPGRVLPASFMKVSGLRSATTRPTQNPAAGLRRGGRGTCRGVAGPSAGPALDTRSRRCGGSEYSGPGCPPTMRMRSPCSPFAAAEQRQDYPPESPSRRRRRRRPRRSPRRPARSPLDLRGGFFDPRRREGDDRDLLEVVGDEVTPSGADRELKGVVVSIAETRRSCRDRGRRASTVISRVTCSRRRRLARRGDIDALELDRDSAWIASSSFTAAVDVLEAATDRCSCVLTTTGTALPPSTRGRTERALGVTFEPSLRPPGSALPRPPEVSTRAPGPREHAPDWYGSRIHAGGLGGSVRRGAADPLPGKETGENTTCAGHRACCDSKIPKAGSRRSAKLALPSSRPERPLRRHQGGQRRPFRGGQQRELEQRTWNAIKMSGRWADEGAAMKLGQFASFIDTEFIPRSTARSTRSAAKCAPTRGDAVGEGGNLEEEYDGEPSPSCRRDRDRAFAPPRSARSTGGVLDGRRSRSDPVPGSPRRSTPTSATPHDAAGRPAPGSTPRRSPTDPER